MKIIPIIVICFIMVLILVLAYPLFFNIKYKLSDKNTEELLNICKNKILALNLPDVNNLTIDKLRVLHQSHYPVWQKWAKGPILVVTTDGRLAMEIDSKTKKVISFSNKYIVEKTKNIKDIEVKQKRTKADIIQQAEKYIKILNGGIPNSYNVVSASYRLPKDFSPEGPKDGFWVVIWSRNVKQLYTKDRIEVSISEKYGLKSCYYGLANR